jgi:ferredoxin-NADP reductase
VRAEARDILRVELADPAGAQLPAFEPGAHLVLELANGKSRPCVSRAKSPRLVLDP